MWIEPGQNSIVGDGIAVRRRPDLPDNVSCAERVTKAPNLGGRMDQHQLTIIVAVVVVLVLIAVVGFLLLRKRRSQILRARFGPEYDRVVKKEGNIGRGEDVLQFRAKRRERLEIVPLSSHNRSES